MLLLELFNSKTNYQVDKDDERTFKTSMIMMSSGDTPMMIGFEANKHGDEWEIGFGLMRRDGSLSYALIDDFQGPKTLAFVKRSLEEVIQKKHPKAFGFATTPNRAAVYKRMFMRFKPSDYSMTVEEFTSNGQKFEKLLFTKN